MTARAWVEPAALLPLRWGGYRERVVAGLVLIVGGLVHLQAASTLNLLPLAVGTAAHVAGWAILPASAGRRLGPAGPSALAIWLLLTGPQSMWILIVPYVGWLVARHRPARSYLTLAPVLLNGALAIALFREYDQQLLALGLSAVVLTGSAWWAWAMARPAPASAAVTAEPGSTGTASA
ncbi:hypothetical protein [Microcella frigidaquae]|uniref:Uncharacterized protein n=1 Tax=Microcella frigidaquae TaxID=424758 RepID=A0A840X951_9MICO|nr:hypothetical protein [Microcella frigidaquae]MBB5617724.1 hypothetical protein [Microcella frigidaquae]NHN45743.1 hypothetical protein [Microcella frigidaquae]